MNQVRATFVIGALLRGQFRRGLRDAGLSYDEDKGWFDSHFIVSGSAEKMAQFDAAYANWSAAIERAAK